MKTPAFVLLPTLTLVAFFVHAQEADPGLEITGADDLVKMKGRFKETWVRPDADFTRYGQLRLQVTELQYREVKGNPAQAPGPTDTRSEFALTEEEQERFRQVATEAFVDELGRSKKLQVVDESGPETLIVRASILDIVCRLPPITGTQVDMYPSTVGEATLRFELIDAENGVMQARLEERSSILPSGRIGYEISPRPVNRKLMWKDVDQWSRNGASDLRRVLNKAHSGHGLTR
jgi:hypothetical protein